MYRFFVSRSRMVVLCMGVGVEVETQIFGDHPPHFPSHFFSPLVLPSWRGDEMAMGRWRWGDQLPSLDTKEPDWDVWAVQYSRLATSKFTRISTNHTSTLFFISY